MSNQKFWDKIAPRYAKVKISDIESYHKKLQATQEHLTKDMDVLEIGCGTGMTAIAHAPFVHHYHATDMSEVMIDIAKGRAKESDIDNISFEVSDFSSLQIANESKDAVLAMSVLHLLEDVHDGIREVASKLKPGGLFISSTMCLGDKMWYLRAVVPLMRLVGYAPSTVHFFKKDDLLSAITSHNFSILYEWQPSPTKACFVIARKM